MKFDIKVKDIEPVDGRKSVMAFYLKLAPKWFEWLGWMLILGTLYYFAIKGKSYYIGTIAGLTQIFLWAYFIAFFRQIEFVGVPFLKTSRQERIFSVIVGLVMSFIFWDVAMVVAYEIGALTKG